MQDYKDFAQKNNISLSNSGACQCCGAETQRGIHECVELFNLGFSQLDYSVKENHIYRFLSVDAHTLQHAEIHGRWNNHFHLTRLHLILSYHLEWSYSFSPLLSNHLKAYKKTHEHEYLNSPPLLKRGHTTVTDVIKHAIDQTTCEIWIKRWAKDVYLSWNPYHDTVDKIASSFIKTHKNIRKYKV